MTPNPLVKVVDLTKVFPPATAWFGARALQHTGVAALDHVSFQIPRGRVVGLAGESGSGKTTLAEVLLGLQVPTAGAVYYEGTSVPAFLHRDRRGFRRRVQMIFQNPYESLNPRFSVERAVEEPLLIHGIGTRSERRARMLSSLTDCGLRPAEAFLARLPHELSGGQRQRVAIARATVITPEFLVADEPVSMLDVSVRSGILNLFADLRRRQGLTILYISHDLATIRYLCDETIILYRGRIVESGPTATVIDRPSHAYTAALVAAVPAVSSPQHDT